MDIGLNRSVGSVGFSGLHHSADCVEGGVKANGLCLSGLHVGVIHWVFKRRLTIGALMANVAIKLDLGSCPEKQKQ